MAIAPQTLEEATQLYSKANDDLRVATGTFYERIALYSGGIISASVTFIGYALSKSDSVLLYEFWGVPLYTLIFVSWGALFASLVLGIYIGLFSAQHISRLFYYEWITRFAHNRSEMLEKIKRGEANLDGVSEDEMPARIREAEEAVQIYRGIPPIAKRMNRIYDFIAKYIRKATSGLFIFGCFSALVFLALSVLVLAGAI